MRALPNLFPSIRCAIKRFVGLSYGGIAVILATVTLRAGCADSRISFDTLRDMEQGLADVEPVEVEPENLTLTEMHPYTVGSGDVLLLTMVGLLDPFSETRIQQRVDDQGRISLPLVGQVQVGGLDLQTVDQAIRNAAVPKYVKALTVFTELLGPEGTTVVIVREAGEPVLLPLPGNRRNVLYALAQSGGLAPGTSGRVHVRPIDPAREELIYDLTDVNDLRRALLAPPLESGDMIVVESAEASVIYVTGLVNAPGPVFVPKGGNLSLVRTIAASGGLRDILEPEEATLWRRLANGEQVRVKLELADIMDGKSADIALCSGDVLEVPHTAKTRFLEWAVANIRIGPFGVTGMYDPVADSRARILRNDRGGNVNIRDYLLQTLGTGVSNMLVPPVPVQVVGP